MNSSIRRKLEEVEKILKRLISQSESGIPIIVEGRRDEVALRRLKIQGEIICLKARGNCFRDFTANFIGKREVAILTDFDREGTRLAAKLVDELSHMRIKTDITAWKRLKALCRPEVRAVEELAGYVERLRVKSIAD
ncbi:MAG: hypothetical protein ACUVTM_04305 [Candidatus Bathyarchaeia archaeon]